MRYGFGYHHADHWMAFGILMPLLWLVFVAAIVWIVVRILMQRGAFHPPHPLGPPHESPEEILDRRFASGEIDAEAHAAARQHLKDHPR